MNTSLVYRILELYDLEAGNVQTVQKGYRNQSYAAKLPNGQTVNVIVYKREPGILRKIKNANYVSDFLAAHNYPARQTADSRIVRLGGGHKYAALYNYLPGATIPWEAYTMEHLKQLGGAMSNMHALLARLPQNDLPLVLDECRALQERTQHYFGQSGVQRALRAKLKLQLHLPAFDFSNPKQSQAQALHMDFVRGNILFNGERQITGVLDFEKATWGAPIFDIARTLAFLLVDCKYKDEAKVRKYFLHSGYNKRGASSFAPTAELEHLVDFFLLHDFYKFLRHNPYESLPQNEHLIRTRNFLLKRNILAPSGMIE